DQTTAAAAAGPPSTCSHGVAETRWDWGRRIRGGRPLRVLTRDGVLRPRPQPAASARCAIRAAAVPAPLIWRWVWSEDRQRSVAFDSIRDAGCVVVWLCSGMELDRVPPVLDVGTRVAGATPRF